MALTPSHFERIADIEGMGRHANEEIAAATPPAVDPAHEEPYRCECGDDACERSLALPRSVYERVRSDPMQFVVAPGHVVPEAERVIEETERFWVVYKNEGVHGVVESSDPRARRRASA
jgi:hypothetical protein